MERRRLSRGSKGKGTQDVLASVARAIEDVATSGAAGEQGTATDTQRERLRRALANLETAMAEATAAVEEAMAGLDRAAKERRKTAPRK